MHAYNWHECGGWQQSQRAVLSAQQPDPPYCRQTEGPSCCHKLKRLSRSLLGAWPSSRLPRDGSAASWPAAAGWAASSAATAAAANGEGSGGGEEGSGEKAAAAKGLLEASGLGGGRLML